MTRTSTPIPSTIGQPKGHKRKYSELSSAVKELRANSELLMKPEAEQSETETFGLYVGKCLDKFPPMQNALAQQEIQGILTKYKIALIDNTPHASTSSSVHSEPSTTGTSRRPSEENRNRQEELHYPFYQLNEFLELKD